MEYKKLLKQNLGKFGVLVLRSLIISAILIGTFSKIPVSKTLGWMDLGWQYRKPITVSNSGSTLTNEDVLVTVDTLSLVNDGKLQSSCADLRFTDSDENTTLSYWIESGCNTSSTKIWTRIPSLTAGGKTIYMYYGNPSAVSTALTWSGNVYMYADTTCPVGWTRASDLDGQFLYGDTTFGTTGGADSHTQGDATCTSSSISTTDIAGTTSGSLTGTTTTHTHTNLKSTLLSANVLPSYTGVILCYKESFLLSQGLISMFNTTAPSGYTRVTALDNKLVRASDTYGMTGGSDTHTHSTTNTYTTGTPTGTQTVTPALSATGGTVTTSGSYTIHSFTSSGTFATNKAATMDVLVVGGGGGGGFGAYGGGGGGAGGLVYSTGRSVPSGNTTVTVGNGGAVNNSGGNSSFGLSTPIIGYGGGRGAAYPDYGALSGGCGGGGDWVWDGAGGTQGYAGGGSGGCQTGGGGGMGGAGESGVCSVSNGNGGSGVQNSITGTAIWYSAGGGGEGTSSRINGIGGSGYGAVADPNGSANTGSGGGGGGTLYLSGGSGGSGIVIIRYLTQTPVTYASSTHTHSSSSSTPDTVSNIPPYLDMVFAKADNATYVDENNVIITSELPPLGWNRFTALDNRFPRATTTYGDTGGSDTHTHSVSISTGAPSATISGYGSGTNFADSTHTHSCTVTSQSASNLPAYTTVIYAQRKTSQLTALGAEDVQNTPPNAPTLLLTEGNTDPSAVSDYTPEFSAVFTDLDGDDTGNYYQIQVNTSSDFLGISMWDSTKTAFVPAISNSGRSTDIPYAGSELLPGQTYYWRMKFWDSNSYQNESSWSSTAQFTMNAIPTALANNISNISDIYASLPISIQTIYSDQDGSTDLDRLYVKLRNPSTSTDIEYYISPTGSNQIGEYPTPVSGSEFISGITYDTQYNTPNSTDITVTWHITTNWAWTQTSELSYGVKALDYGGGESTYSYTSATYKYENRLIFSGDLSVKDSEDINVSEASWYPANNPMTVSGVKVVYFGTTNLYPQDSQFDVKLVNEELTEWYDTTSSGENISINCTAPTVSNADDTYTLSIINIPDGSSTSTLAFDIRTDVDNPVVPPLTSTSNPSESTWYENHTGDISWTIEDDLSGIYKSWRLIDQTQNQTLQNISSNGTEIAASGTYSFSINQDGTWYIHIASMDNVGLSTIQTYKLQIDSQSPTFSSVSSTTHPSQTIWYPNKVSTVSWQVQDLGSGIGKVWAYTSSRATEEEVTISTNGTEKSATDSFTMTDLTNGIWYLHLLAQDNTGRTSYTRYTVKIDASTPDIVDVTGSYEGILQNIDSGPTISWTSPNSSSGDTYYITNNGTEPTSSNYTYYTTAITYNLPAQKQGDTTIKVKAINGAGTYSQTQSFLIRYDSVAPTNVSSLKAEKIDEGVALSWTNPTDSDFQKLIVIRNENKIPTSLSNGTKIYEGTLNTFLDQNATDDKVYYYAIYVYDTVGNISSGSVISSPTQESPTESRVIDVANLSVGKQVSISINNLAPTILSTSNVHVYSEQILDITVPAQTIKDEISNPSQVKLVVGNQTYLMSYDDQTDSYTARITSPSVKGAYDTQIQVTSASNENALTLAISILVDPYGYVYIMSNGNEMRISNAKVSLYTKVNNEKILWVPVSGETNPQYTNQQGEYQFFVQSGEYKLVVEASGYIPMETEWFTIETNTIEKNIEVKKNYIILYIILGFVELIIGICVTVFLKKKKRKLKNLN